LGVADLGDGVKNLLAQWGELAREIEHRNGLRDGGRHGCNGTTQEV